MDRRRLDDETIVNLRERGLDGRLELDALAAEDANLARTLADWDRQDASMRTLYGPVADEPIPDRLLAIANRRHLRRWSPAWTRIAAILAIFVCGAATGWIAATMSAPGEFHKPLAAEALRAHSTFVVEVVHPVEVPGSDETHLANWLSKRLGHKIKPPDFARYGFQLMGGRILPEENGAAAQMMYEDNSGRRLTLYVAREQGARETAFRFVEGDQVNGFWWIDGELGCAIIGDLPRETLRSISVSAYDQLI
jgi:anti-sigma factor RsiW